MFDLIGIDWGEKRCGVAFGSTQTGLIIPHNHTVTNAEVISYLEGEVKVRGIKTLIIGIPTTIKLQPTKINIQINKFIEYLKTRIPDLTIIKINERGTTQTIRSKFGRQNTKLKSKINQVDNLAAAEILRIYLDN